MSSTYLGSCDAARERFHIGDSVRCCDSCHDDIDNGYDDGVEIEVEDGFFQTCCAILRAIGED